MGVLAKISRRVFSSRQGVKDGLTMVTTTEEENVPCIVGGETGGTTTNSEDDLEICRQCVVEPPPPHHGVILTSPSSKSCGIHKFFSDDFDQTLYDDDEDTMTGPMILLHASDCLSGSSGSGSSDEVDHTQMMEHMDTTTTESRRSDNVPSCGYDTSDDTIEEPSFEAAWMESSFEVPPSPLEHLSLGTKITGKGQRSSSASRKCLEQRLSKPEKRFDQYGRPFVHVYTEGLSTLFEFSEKTPVHCAESMGTLLLPQTLEMQKSASDDDLQIKARWEVSRQEENERKENYCSKKKRHTSWYKNILSPRSGVRSDFEI